jgi:hypothetical protein
MKAVISRPVTSMVTQRSPRLRLARERAMRIAAPDGGISVETVLSVMVRHPPIPTLYRDELAGPQQPIDACVRKAEQPLGLRGRVKETGRDFGATANMHAKALHPLLRHRGSYAVRRPCRRGGPGNDHVL